MKCKYCHEPITKNEEKFYGILANKSNKNPFHYECKDEFQKIMEWLKIMHPERNYQPFNYNSNYYFRIEEE